MNGQKQLNAWKRTVVIRSEVALNDSPAPWKGELVADFPDSFPALSLFVRFYCLVAAEVAVSTGLLEFNIVFVILT